MSGASFLNVGFSPRTGDIVGIKASSLTPYLHILKAAGAITSDSMTLASYSTFGPGSDITESYISHPQGNRGKLRPGIILSQPDDTDVRGIKQRAGANSYRPRTYYVALMVTFRGTNITRLSQATRHFLIPINGTSPFPERPGVLNVTPDWPRRPQYAIAIRFRVSARCVKPWDGNISHGRQSYRISARDVRVFEKHCSNLFKDFNRLLPTYRRGYEADINADFQRRSCRSSQCTERDYRDQTWDVKDQPGDSNRCRPLKLQQFYQSGFYATADSDEPPASLDARIMGLSIGAQSTRASRDGLLQGGTFGKSHHDI